MAKLGVKAAETVTAENDAGSVAARARDAVADNLLQPHEIRSVVNGLDSLIEGTLDLLGDLRHELKGANRGA